MLGFTMEWHHWTPIFLKFTHLAIVMHLPLFQMASHTNYLSLCPDPVIPRSMALHGVHRCFTSRRKVLTSSAEMGQSTRLVALFLSEHHCVVCSNNSAVKSYSYRFGTSWPKATVSVYEIHWIVSCPSVHKQINLQSASFCYYSLVNLQIPRHRTAARQHIHYLSGWADR